MPEWALGISFCPVYHQDLSSMVWEFIHLLFSLSWIARLSLGSAPSTHFSGLWLILSQSIKLLACSSNIECLLWHLSLWPTFFLLATPKPYNDDGCLLPTPLALPWSTTRFKVRNLKCFVPYRTHCSLLPSLPPHPCLTVIRHLSSFLASFSPVCKHCFRDISSAWTCSWLQRSTSYSH